MECKAEVGKAIIVAVKGDITQVKVDAIVNPANSLLIMGGGVAGALKRVGGQIIEDEARRQAPVPVGSAVSTTAGKLPARFIIHAPTMERPAMRTTAEKVRLAVKAALREGERIGAATIGFPGMGTGVGGLNYDEAAETMIRAMAEHLSEPESKIEGILLVAYTDELLESFCRALERLAGKEVKAN